ncbi:hypothetical protein PAECIP111893_04310 [Paenibacillus plantiphilus]|uniref:Zinc ribbon domain-containing protein n=1 Tax=Paenibacillus plantiphilus TaxID=2905650 RepID=A0ABM9CP80_9BACL|nr:hypothetical protein [Paenibacillus plantiphilus]CAH1217800.1 hypothetical protein PAECIP111893_04310 [Paenibacillus plantiphilus]
MIGNGMYPLMSLMSGLASVIVLLFAVALVGAMIYIIRLTTDDSDKHSQLKAFVEALFNSPNHLHQQGSDDNEKDASAQAKQLHALSKTPFSEPCPACLETVTHEHAECPSCGLRLL